MEIKRRKDSSGEEYSWNDYMSLPFTQNVSPLDICIYKR